MLAHQPLFYLPHAKTDLLLRSFVALGDDVIFSRTFTVISEKEERLSQESPWDSLAQETSIVSRHSREGGTTESGISFF
jgi:hypothetical protein